MKEFFLASRTFYPAIFRVLIGILLLVDLCFLFPSFGILFNSTTNAYLPSSGIGKLLTENAYAFGIVYSIILLAFVLGIGKNFVSFLAFIGYFFILEMTKPLMTWGDTILKFTLLYFVFVDSFRFLALTKSTDNENFLSRIGVWSILLHLFLIYLNNAYFKLIDKDWQEGIAVFYSFSQYSGSESSLLYPIVSNGIGTKILNYFIIIQQLSFVPLVIWKKTRIYALILSICIHIIMMIEFELWKFEMIVILLYGFILSDQEWKSILSAKFIPKYFSK